MKIWLLSLNLLVSAWVFIDVKNYSRKLAWSAGAFLLTIVVLPVYLARSGRRPLIVAIASFCYCIALVSGVPYARFEAFVKGTPLMKTDLDGSTVFWPPAAYDGGRWANTQIVAVGTSITAGANARFLDGFVDQAVRWHNAKLLNMAVGSSGIVWDGLRERSLSATRLELMKAGFDQGQSFESRLIGAKADLIIFDHGYNDRDQPIGSIDDSSPTTFHGAYNRVIQAVLAERSDQPMLFLTPPSLYTPYDGGKINEHTVAIRKAILAIAEKYRSPVLDMSALAGFDGASSDKRLFPDGVHPNSEGHRRMALLLYEYLAELQKTLHARN